MRKTSIRRFIAWPAAILLLIVIALALGTITPRPIFAAAVDAGSVDRSAEILVISNPIHTDIAIRLTEKVKAQFAFVQAEGVPIDNPDAAYLILGWGGRSFYLETPTWADLKPMPVLRALTIDRSVMHVDVARASLATNPSARRLMVSQAGLDHLIAYSLDSFARDKAGHPISISGAGYSSVDAFFEAGGAFNAFAGCNTWTAGALRRAGLRTGWWNPLPQSLSLSLALLN
jgi:uncharacterized protein (TIGR02117 family)